MTRPPAEEGPSRGQPSALRWLLPLLLVAAVSAAVVVVVGLGRGPTSTDQSTEAALRSDDFVEQSVASDSAPIDPGDLVDGIEPTASGPQPLVWIDPMSSSLPWQELGAVDGLLTFRGNPTRSYHGRGPVPAVPVVDWTFDIGCSISSVGAEARQWCGTGWTGQPLIFPAPGAELATRPESMGWWLAVGGYNRAINFLQPQTGEQVYPPFFTGDIIKGTATADPDGFPLLYTGSRDNALHVVALDRPEPVELWQLSSEIGGRTLWNDDWDGSPMVINDLLIVGGENSRFYVVKLNREYGPDGLVTIDPAVIASVAGWDQQLLNDLGDVQVSIENSVAISGSIAYFANSGGLVQGWDLAPLHEGDPPERVFRFWTGDDTDATVVVDENGQLYVGSEYERGSGRANDLGQIFRLDPTSPDDPLVWSLQANRGIDTGIWATPALYRDLVLVATDDGRVLGIERDSGEIRWTLRLDPPLWSSPVVVDDTLIQADCSGQLHAFDLTNTSKAPRRLWTLPLEGCIESTPAVWDGHIYVGTRAGTFFGIGDARPDLAKG